MSLINKVLASSVALGMLFVSATNAWAEEKVEPEESSSADAVLFRIENIRPEKNSEGLIDKCRFLITVYNRTPKNIKSATLDFKWVDNISGKFAVSGDAVKVVDPQKSVKVVTKEVTLETINSHKQRSFEEVVETDKCYLLFDSLDFNVKSCAADGEKNVQDKKGGCAGKFEYINSKNPEYYSEFKDVPDSVIEKQVEDEKKQEVSKITTSIEASMKELKETVDVLNKIK